jgi:hypothetical protein
MGLILALLLSSCGQELRDECARNAGNCLRCDTDEECVVRSQPCYDYALCVHRDVEINFTSIGCAFEHQAPGDDACRCIGGACHGED